MEFNSDSYVVLWSPHQNVFHVQTVSEMIRQNRFVFNQQRPGGDYIVLGFSKTKKEAQAASSKLIAHRNNSVDKDT